MENRSIIGKLVAFGASAAAFAAGSVGGMELLSSAAKALGTHIFAEVLSKLGSRLIERSREKVRPGEGASLEDRVILAIDKVLDEVIANEPGGEDGVQLLKAYKAEIPSRLSDASIDPQLQGIFESVSQLKAFTPEIWKHFLHPDYEVLLKFSRRWLFHHAALNEVANALCNKLPTYLVDAYGNAFAHDPKLHFEVQADVLKEFYNGISGIAKKQNEHTAVLDLIRGLAQSIAFSHPVQMQAYVNEFAATAGEFRTVLSEITSLLSETHADVKELLRRDDARSSDNPLTPAQIQQNIALYLDWLIKHTKIIELRGIKHGDTPVIQLDLKDAYVPLQAKRLQDIESTFETSDLHQLLHVIRSKQAAKSNGDVPMKKVLGEGNRLAITGGAGSGKTTVVRYIAWRLATALRGDQALSEDTRLGLASDVALPVPILVSFASFARYQRDLPGHTPGNLESFLVHDLVRNEANFELSPGFFKQLLKEGRDVILLLDGLDEVADAHEREKMRDWVSSFARDRAALRVVATCRTAAYRNDAALAQFKEIAVLPLHMKMHIAPMVRQAYACINVDQREARITQLLSGIEQLEAIRRASPGYDGKALVDSPLMVRLMLIVQMNNRELPDERADLFAKAVDALFQVEYGVEVDNKKEIARNWERYRDMAQHLAFHLHQQGKDQGREIEEPVLRQLLHKEPDFKPHIDDFLRLVRLRGGVVEVRGDKFIFMHHAFQEFLVARYLCEVTQNVGGIRAVLDYLKPHLTDPWWREPVLLTAEYHTSSSTGVARKMIGALAITDDPQKTRFSAAELAATAALEWRDSGPEIKALCAERIVALLKELENNDALQNSQPVVRARAGDALSRLGDPRFDPNYCYLPKDPMFGFVAIPEDKNFIIGTRSKNQTAIAAMFSRGPESIAYEINDANTATPLFYIARYPVTVAQFRASGIMRAYKYPFDEVPDYDEDVDSRPVCRISWSEAVDYCQWLQKQFTSVPTLKVSEIGQKIQTGNWCITLPSELEWEKAVRGVLIDEVFPWRGEADINRANYSDTGTNARSVVGCYPPNGYGLYDMVGNVWEWTRSLWGKDWENPDFVYPYYAATIIMRENLKAADNVLRVMRGGARGHDAFNARCAMRGRDNPNIRLGNIGFRVALCSPPL
jgi:hypothetical protein